MSFPNYPNPAQRAQIFEAHLLRQQGLTYRQIGERMDRAVSTVHSYLHAFEQFRTDLIAELAADQIVSHLLQLADLDDPHHGQRLADIRELRLLLGSLPAIRRDESERTADILRSGVAVDRYGQRFTKPDRLYPTTPEEEAQIEQLAQREPPHSQPEPDQPLALLPNSSRTEPNTPEQDLRPPPVGEVSRSDGGGRSQPAAPEPSRTEPNTPEQNLRPPPLGEVSRSDGGGRPQPATPESDRTEPNTPEQDLRPPPVGEVSRSDGGGRPQPATPTLSRAERRRLQRSNPNRRGANAA